MAKEALGLDLRALPSSRVCRLGAFGLPPSDASCWSLGMASLQWLRNRALKPYTKALKS